MAQVAAKKKDKADKIKINLDDAFKGSYKRVDAEALNKMREQKYGKKLPSITARSIAQRLFKDDKTVMEGETHQVANPAHLHIARRMMLKDLNRVAKAEGRNVVARCITDEKNSTLTFLYDPKKQPKKDKDKAKTEKVKGKAKGKVKEDEEEDTSPEEDEEEEEEEEEDED